MEHDSVFRKLEASGAWLGGPGTYAEPGYDAEKPALFGDWNRISKELASALEDHYNLQWDDEWVACEECGRYVRVEPNCYAWQPYYADIHGIVCGDCIRKDSDEYLDRVINNPSTAMLDFLEPTDYGFEKVNPEPYASGLHTGMTDVPAEVLKKYLNNHPDEECVFTIEPSQFYVRFDLWARKKTEV